jgi:large-conductance mechanosensitive channel
MSIPDPLLKSWSWIRDNIALFIIIGSAVFTVGRVYAEGQSIKTRMDQVEQNSKSDHDLLIEIKNDIKWLVRSRDK